MNIPILYSDAHLIIVDKPRHIHVHPTLLSPRENSVQTLLERAGQGRLYPVHRLDRPVGGLLLFARSTPVASKIALALRKRENLRKHYLCLVRGWMQGSGLIEKPLRQSPGKPPKEARTQWRSLAITEVPWSDGRFSSSRYSLVECLLETGRYHQIRRHLASVNHPIIGDSRHGDRPKNRLWQENTAIEGLMLQSQKLFFFHPITGKKISIRAPEDPRFIQARRFFNAELLETEN